jgi:hypothetical protein
MDPFKQEWKGWGDWLGTGTIARQNMQYRTFEEARDYVHALGLKNKEEWSKYCKSGKKPKDIPANPREPYEKEWLGWGDWLGTGAIANQKRQFRSFEQAKEYVHTLGLKSKEEWGEYS